MGRISKLHEYTLDRINGKFPHLHVMENYYPEWLTSPMGTRLELDIFIDDLKIAAEIQGGQHSFFVPFFHGTRENFEKQKEYDEHKRLICQMNGINLYDIATEQDADIMVYEINSLLDELSNNKPTYFYQERNLSKRKFRKLFKHTDPLLIKERTERARTKFELWKSGKLTASEEKVKGWLEILS